MPVAPMREVQVGRERRWEIGDGGVFVVGGEGLRGVLD
jgi:hypothetical protein